MGLQSRAAEPSRHDMVKIKSGHKQNEKKGDTKKVAYKLLLAFAGFADVQGLLIMFSDCY